MAQEDSEATRENSGGLGTIMLPGQATADERSDADFSLKCLKEKQIPMLVILTITALIITVIALAAKKTPPCPSCSLHVTAACPDGWVGFQGKCSYFSEMEQNWSASRNHCASLNASLATVDSLPELAFMLRYRGLPFHWIGLQREQDQSQPWKWTNGTVFNNLFEVRGEGQCAYLNDRGVSSSRCHSERQFICSRLDECSQRKPSATKADTISKIT